MFKTFITNVVIFIVFSAPLHAAQIEVIEVLDGDTLLVKDGDKQKPVAVYGIDAPELGQSFAEEAKAYLEKLLLEKNVYIEASSSYSLRHDSYIIYYDHESGARRNVGCELIYTGLAYYDRQLTKNNLKARAYINSEKYAKEKKMGVWLTGVALGEQEFPWQFRQNNNIKTEEETYAKKENIKLANNPASKIKRKPKASSLGALFVYKLIYGGGSSTTFNKSPRYTSRRNEECYSDFDCGIGRRCIKKPLSITGVCLTEVDDTGLKTFSLPSADNIGPNMNLDGECSFNTDCPIGFRCDRSLKACVK